MESAGKLGREMTALSLPTPSPLAPEAPTVTLRSGALLHRVRAAAVAAWRLAPGRYLAIPDGDEIVVLPLGRLTRIGRRATCDIVLDDSTVSRRQPRNVRTSGSGLPRRAATTIGARSARAAISS